MDLANLGGGAGDPFATDALGAALDEAAEKKKKKKKKETDESAELTKKEDLIHIRVQQRNGRKCITTVQGLDQNLDLKKIIKAIKKAHCCNGTIVEDEDMGQVLQFQGDQRDAVVNFLTGNEICD